MNSQTSLFPSSGGSDLQTCVNFAKDLHRQMLLEFNPYATILLVSGGKDSTASLIMCELAGIVPDFIVHVHTGTGVPAALDHVQRIMDMSGVTPVVASAGRSYVDYVTKRGFFGVGSQAHSHSYHLLKHQPLNAWISANIRKRKHNRRVLLLNGARATESVRRSHNMASPFRVARSNIWVNLINFMHSDLVRDLVLESRYGLSPVYGALCKSGECLCGSMCNRAEELAALKHFDRNHFNWLMDLESYLLGLGFTWRWGEQRPKSLHPSSKLQRDLFEGMCVDCIRSCSADV